MIRILHTSDWHIGWRLKERDRSGEFREFFSWLSGVIREEKIDVLLVAGDVFDNTTPSVQAQEIYYSFLAGLAESSCRHTVIISGNHDSPAFLDAPSSLLNLSDIHVIGTARDDPAEEVITLEGPDGRTELIVCAVPYLRDRDVRTLTASDNPGDSERELLAGIRGHYSAVFERARELQGDSDVAVVAMGHMFIKGGRTVYDDGVRALYVGTALQVGCDVFPEWVTYTALGHLHSPQRAGREDVRYSGSPVAMGFGEAGQQKGVYILEVEGRSLVGVREVRVPVFQRLERACGTMQDIWDKINALGREEVSVWVDVAHTGRDSAVGLQERVNDLVRSYPLLEVLSVRDESKAEAVMSSSGIGERELGEIDPLVIFRELLDSRKVDEEKRKIFMPMYQEILHGIEVGQS